MTLNYLLIVCIIFIPDANRGLVEYATNLITRRGYHRDTGLGSSDHRSRRSDWFNNKSCRSLNSCTNELKFARRKCHCDNMCHDLGDCCWDATVSTTHKYTNKDAMPAMMTCVALEKSSAFWVVSSCPKKYTNREIKAKCTKTQSTHANDPDLVIPVLETESGLIYRNRFCAECHRVVDAVPYNISLTGFGSGCERPITSDPLKVLNHYLGKNSSCSIEFVSIDRTKQRRCFSHNLVSICSSNNSELMSGCESGALNPVYALHDFLLTEEVRFKNYDCYACSAIYPSMLATCHSTDVAQDSQETKVLIDTRNLFDRIGKLRNDSVCQENEIYDKVYVRILHIILSQSHIYFFFSLITQCNCLEASSGQLAIAVCRRLEPLILELCI